MPSKPAPTEPPHSSTGKGAGKGAGHGLGSGVTGSFVRVLMWVGAAALAGVFSLVMIIGIALAVAFPNLPDISDLSNYRPVLPLRVFSSEGVLIGDFGE